MRDRRPVIDRSVRDPGPSSGDGRTRDEYRSDLQSKVHYDLPFVDLIDR